MQFIVYCGGTKYLPDGMIVGAKVNKVLTDVLNVVYNSSTDNFEVSITNPSPVTLRMLDENRLYIGVSTRDIGGSKYIDHKIYYDSNGDKIKYPTTAYRYHRNWRVNRGSDFLVTNLNQTIIPAYQESYIPKKAENTRKMFVKVNEHFYYETPILLVLEYGPFGHNGMFNAKRKAGKAVDTGKKIVLEA